jgi:DNA adenine methylase
MHQHPEPLSAPCTSNPFLKWSGGKQRLLKQLLSLLPMGNRLIEPFVGAGSIFLGTTYDRYILNDANPDLVAVWQALKVQPGQFMERAAALFRHENHSASAYLRIRTLFNEEARPFERAVLLPYLSKFGFNGLYRVNRSGVFNVPYGFPKKMPSFPWQQMKAASRKLRDATVLSGDFLGAMAMARVGDVVYCDPPYLASDHGSSFTAYTAAGFTEHDHIQLVNAALLAVEKGATVVISNHDTPATRKLYAGWNLNSLEVRRSIAAKGSARENAKELVALLQPGG